MATTLLEYKDNFWGPGSKGFEALVGRLNQDIEATKEIQEFSRSWRQTEEDYANDLIRNVAMNPVKGEAGTTGNALVTLAQLLDTGVRTYLEVANIFKDELELPLDDYKKKLRKLKKQIESDYDKVYKQFQKEVMTTDRLQKEYAAKVKEVALLSEKANKTTGGSASKKVATSEAELEKIAGEYRAAVEKCDRMQDVYEAKHQEICAAVETHERERFQLVKTGLEKVVGSQVGKLFHFKEKIYERMVDVVSNINIDEDIQQVIAFAGSGTERPERRRFSETTRLSRSDLFNDSRGSPDAAGDGNKQSLDALDIARESSPAFESMEAVGGKERTEFHEHHDISTKAYSLRMKRSPHNNRVDVAQRKRVQSTYEVSDKRYHEDTPKFDLNELKSATLERGKRSLANALSKMPGRSAGSSTLSLRRTSRSVDFLGNNLPAVSSSGDGRPDVVDPNSRTSLTTLSHLRTNTAPAATATGRPVSRADSSTTLSFTPAANREKGHSGNSLQRSEQSFAEANFSSPDNSSNALSSPTSIPSQSLSRSATGEGLAGASAGNLRLSSAAISPSVSNTSIAQIYRASLVGEQRVIIRNSISEEPGAFDNVLKAHNKQETNRRKSVHEGNRYAHDKVLPFGESESSSRLKQNVILETPHGAEETGAVANKLKAGTWVSVEHASAISVVVELDADSGTERPYSARNEPTAEADPDKESEVPALPDKSKAGRENALKRRSGSPTNSARSSPTTDAPTSSIASNRFEGRDIKEDTYTRESTSRTNRSAEDIAAASSRSVAELEAETARSRTNNDPNSSYANTQKSPVPSIPIPRLPTKPNTSRQSSPGVSGDQTESPAIPPRTFSPKPIPAPRPNLPLHRLSQYTQNSLPAMNPVTPAAEITPVNKNQKFDGVVAELNKITRSTPDFFPTLEHNSDGTLKRKSRQFSPRKSKIQGWVYLCEDNVKTWVHRWTCLEGGYLWFFEQPEDFQKCNKPRGMVAICTSQTSNTVVKPKIDVPWTVPDSENRPFSVSLIVNVNKSLVLSWENEEESNKWVEVLVAETSAARKLAADP